MKTTRYDEREVTEWLHRHGPSALVWAALFAFFALAGVSSHDKPRPMADVVPDLPLMANENDGVPDIVQSLQSAREPALRDPAIVAHEALDPVGVGLNTTR
jgi:hypothetical protein